jgi:hypothetical protein
LIQADYPKTGDLCLFHRLAEIAHASDRNELGCPGRNLANRRRHSCTPACRHHDPGYAGPIRRPQQRAEVVRIGDPVEKNERGCIVLQQFF